MWATWRVKANKCNKDKYQISNNWRASFAFWGLPLKDHSWSSIYHLPYFHHCGIGDWSGLGFERGLEQLNCGQYCLEPRERKIKSRLKSISPKHLPLSFPSEDRQGSDLFVPRKAFADCLCQGYLSVKSVVGSQWHPPPETFDVKQSIAAEKKCFCVRCSSTMPIGFLAGTRPFFLRTRNLPSTWASFRIAQNTTTHQTSQDTHQYYQILPVRESWYLYPLIVPPVSGSAEGFCSAADFQLQCSGIAGSASIFVGVRSPSVRRGHQLQCRLGPRPEGAASKS